MGEQETHVQVYTLHIVTFMHDTQLLCRHTDAHKNALVANTGVSHGAVPSSSPSTSFSY